MRILRMIYDHRMVGDATCSLKRANREAMAIVTNTCDADENSKDKWSEDYTVNDIEMISKELKKMYNFCKNFVEEYEEKFGKEN